VPGEATDLTFRYQTARLWQQPVEALLTGPLGTLPLAPLADVRPEALPEVLRRLAARVEREAPSAQGASLKIVAFTLLGLRLSSGAAEQLMPGIRNMRDSSTYQLILDEGRAEGRTEEARRMLVLFGAARLGPPDARVLAALEAIADPEQLEQLGQRLLTVANWGELLTIQ
jgi:predicted transposase YdaD